MREVPHLIKKALHIMATTLHIIKQIDIRQSWRSIEGSLSLSGKKVVIVSTEELHFYGTGTPFY